MYSIFYDMKNSEFSSLLVDQKLRTISFVKTSQAIKVWVRQIGWMMSCDIYCYGAPAP